MGKKKNEVKEKFGRISAEYFSKHICDMALDHHIEG